MEREQVEEELRKYNWYHRIEVLPGLYTPSRLGKPRRLWGLILEEMDRIEMSGLRVLDVGCRDGLFSLAAERKGAASVVAIDNDLSLGAKEFLLPFLKSRVEMRQMNVMDLEAESSGVFDVILCFGVLYHLRYPFAALKRMVGCLRDGGTLLLESGMLDDERLASRELLYCPVEDSPYEASSCTFFNRKALQVTMHSFDCVLERSATLASGSPGRRYYPLLMMQRLVRRFRSLASLPPRTSRQVMRFRKKEGVFAGRASVYHGLQDYWDATHTAHTNATYGKVPPRSQGP